MLWEVRTPKTWTMPPPDENTAEDPTGAAWVVWLVIVGPVLLFVTLAHVLREDLRLPTGSRVLPLVVRSRTRDGVDVVALADLTIEVHDVVPGTAYVSAVQAVRLAEDTVAESVEGLEVCSLVDDLEALEPRWPAQVTRLLPAGTEVRLDIAADIDVAPSTREALLRIVRESVTNAGRHGHATHVVVALGEDRVLSIEDDGCGFDLDEAATKGRFGLVSMRERAEGLGGRFRIMSGPGRGTRVEVGLP